MNELGSFAMDSDVGAVEEKTGGSRTNRAAGRQADNPLDRFRKQQVEWILQAANYDVVTAALVLGTTVNELRRLMGALGISGWNGVHKRDTIGESEA